MVFRLRYLLSAALLLSSPSFASDSCINIKGTTYNPKDIYPSEHACSACPDHDRPPSCAALDNLVVPNFAAPTDLFPVPHRGLWGGDYGNGPSENTRAAIDAAVRPGGSVRPYNVIEIDIAHTGPADPHRKKERGVFLGHFFSATATTNRDGIAADGPPQSLLPPEVYSLYMRKRNQEKSRDDGDRLASFDEIINNQNYKDVIFMIDPKSPAGINPAEEWASLFADVLRSAKNANSLHRIILKVGIPNGEITALIKEEIDDYKDEYEGKFLWNPITPSSWNVSGPSVERILEFIDDWHRDTEQSKGIASFETNIFSPMFPGGSGFYYHDTWYDNLLDYVRRLTPIGKRSALWSVDPAGNKGTLNREYGWKFIGNTPDSRFPDLRGNPLETLSYRWATHALITTDMPEFYRGMVVNLPNSAARIGGSVQ